MKKLIIILLFIMNQGISQENLIQNTIEEIPMSQDTVRSVYDWIVNNISYDVNKLNAMANGKSLLKKRQFDTEQDYKGFLLSTVIKTKKGVCEDYSLLFQTILSELGYEAYVVEGYTKDSKGNLNRKIGHAWNVVKIGEEWKLYDPTWGAGYVEGDKKFVKSYNVEWYDSEPDFFNDNHMPFDPIWQLKTNPISYRTFEKGDVMPSPLSGMDFEKEIEEYRSQDRKSQMEGQLKRSQNLGSGISVIQRWRKTLARNIELAGINDIYDLLNKATDRSNEAVNSFNKYIQAFNNKFKGKGNGKEMAKSYLEKAYDDILYAKEIYDGVKMSSKKDQSRVSMAKKQVDELLTDVMEQLKFIDSFND